MDALDCVIKERCTYALGAMRSELCMWCSERNPLGAFECFQCEQLNNNRGTVIYLVQSPFRSYAVSQQSVVILAGIGFRGRKLDLALNMYALLSAVDC